MCEDKFGNMWIGTWNNGLNKFNSIAQNFTRYVHKENDPNSISNNAIVSLYSDKFNFLWIGTLDGGLDKFDQEKQIFYHYKNDPGNPRTFSGNAVSSILGSKDGTIWIGADNGMLNKFNRTDETFNSYELKPGNSSVGIITSLIEDHLGYLWIGTNSTGVYRFDIYSNKVIQHLNTSDEFFCSNLINKIFEDKDGIIWIGTENNGLATFDTKSGRINCYTKNSNNPNGINDNTILSIYEDRSGILWFGTWNGGVNKYNKFEKKFTTYAHNSADPYSLSSNSIYAIYVDSFGDLWVSTDIFGLNRRIKGDNKFIHYFSNKDDPHSISNNTVYSICEDSNKNLWIASDDGLNKFDRESNSFIHFKHDPADSSTICSNRISQIFLDSRGNLWIGVLGVGIDKIPKGKEGVVHIMHDSVISESIAPAIIFDFNQDNSGNLWVGTWGGGLIMFDEEKEEVAHYQNDPENELSLSHNEVSVIHIDKSGIMWIGTNGGGLNKFDTSAKTFKRFSEEDGLCSDVICGVLEDDNGNLWISTYKGLSRFNPRTESFRNYSIDDGLQGFEFNNWAYFKDRKGNMYFGGTDGFNVFHPDSLEDNKNIPQIVITNFQILHKPVSVGFDPLWNRTILQKSISETELIELNHYDNIISFEFASLDYRNPIKNRYAYKLEGFDEEWTKTDGRIRYVTYTNLNPGEYIFRVKGSNNDDIWNETGTSIRLIINPPWWATWWAYAVYAIVIILITLSVRVYDLRRQRLKHELELEHEHAEKLEEIDRMRSRFFANISHEFRTPLTLILGPAEKVLTSCKDKFSIKQAGLIRKNAKRLLNLINQLLDLSKLEAGKLKLQASPVNLSSFVKGIVMTFESIAETNDITLKIKLEKEDVEVYLDKDKMQKILTNILSNAFKFTMEGGKITVKLFESGNDTVVITIRDTGVGISKKDLPKLFDRFYQADSSHTREHEGTGLGLALTKELVELHKGQIKIESQEGEWTEVVLELPMGKSHLRKEEIYEFSESEVEPLEIFDDDYVSELDNIDLLDEIEDEKKLVLIVEDNSDVREYIRESIDADYQVIEAVNGEQGLRKAEKIIPDLILSDIMMPKMDGIELLNRIKHDSKTSHIPVILLTAKSEQADKLEGLSIGADAYLTKPFDIEELKVRIKSLIEQRRQLQIKFSKGEYIPDREEQKLNKIDEQFMNRLMGIINIHIAEEEFSIDQFGKEAGMSRSQIHRKLKALTGRSPSQYLRLIRLSRAKTMIEEQKGTVSEISYSVGFSSPAYFSRCFKNEFGYPPSDLVN
jgi:signal transduction histidine kinase/ligand-binding sensor domain-containing protein/DNA-binding response OmpR family regulator